MPEPRSIVKDTLQYPPLTTCDAKDDSVRLQDNAGVARQLAGQSALLMLGNAFTFLVGFPFQIYVAHVLGAKSLGVFGLLEVANQSIGPLFGLGMGHVAVRFLPDYLAHEKTRHIRQLVQTVYVIAIAGSLVALSLVASFSPYLINRVEALTDYGDEMLLMSTMIPLSMLLGISQQVLRGFFDIRCTVIMSSFLQLSLKIALTILFFWLGLELFGYILAVVTSSVLCLIGMFVGIWRQLSRLPIGTDGSTPIEKREWWKYARIMYSQSLLGVFVAPVERTLLASSIGLNSVGVLMVIRQLQAFPQIFLQVIIAIVAPMFVVTRKNSEIAHLYHLATDWMCRLTLPILLFFLVRGTSILEVYGSEFSGSGSLALAIILLGQAVNTGCGPVGTLLNMRGYQSEIFHIVILSAVLQLTALLVLAPYLGLVGVALVTAFAVITTNICTMQLCRTAMGISWFSSRYKRWILPSLIAWCLLMGTKYVMPASTKWWLCTEFGLCCLTFHITYAISGVCDEDLELVSMVRERLAPRLGSWARR
jgi:O-antigen/teichoic acid export membrane protein